MSDFSGTRRFGETEYNSKLQATAVVSVITGVVVLAVCAFLLSYARIHEIAAVAGVPPGLAGLYPLIFDTTLVVACVTALALRGAAWWMRGYAALSIVILLTVVAVVEALHAAGINLPQRPTAATLAAMPWALFLLGFCLWLLMLRHQRTVRAVALLAPAAPDVGLTPAEPKPASPSPDPSAPDVGLAPGLGNEHRHEHRHGHGHGHGDGDGG
jgi:Protein of unknown function (DUF2637)